jgi:uncharacterized protein (TIGR03067 family)
MFIPIFFLSCSSARKATINPNALNGTWIPVKQELGGKELPAAAFEQQQLIISDSSYTFTAESIDKGALQYSNGKMDIYGKEGVNKGKHFTALYIYENGLLSICYNLLGNVYPEALDTKGKPMYFLSVFKKK